MQLGRVPSAERRGDPERLPDPHRPAPDYTDDTLDDLCRLALTSPDPYA
jgi:hypothetical protein